MIRPADWSSGVVISASGVPSHSGTVKARAFAEWLMTLAPTRDDGYEVLSALYSQTRNVDGLKPTDVEKFVREMQDQHERVEAKVLATVRGVYGGASPAEAALTGAGAKAATGA